MHPKTRSNDGVSVREQSVLCQANKTRQPQSPSVAEERSCPSCGRSIEIVDTPEAICPKCDIVVSDQPVSTAPQPRYGESGKERSGQRAGGRVTLLYADRGLGVGIDRNVETDSNGTPLCPTQRRVARQKPWTKRRTTIETRLDYALGEIRRMGGTLGIPDSELEQAARLYRRAHANGLVAGRSVDGFATVCLLVAIRQSSLRLPISIEELLEVTRATEDQVRNARGALELHLSVEVPPMDPADYLPKMSSELGAPQRITQCALTLLRAREREDGNFRALSPRTLAAAAIHAAYDLVESKNRPTLSDLSTATGVSESTISQRKSHVLRYKEVLE